MNDIQEIKRKLISSEAIKNKLENNIERRNCDIKKLKRALKNTEEAHIILQTVAQQTQQELEYKVSEIVSFALSSVFYNPYEFKISFEIKRGKTEANIFLIRDGVQFDPLYGTGFGVVDIVSFALRLTLWNLKRPKSRNTIILDEPFKFVSVGLRSRVADMLSEISKKMNIQFIIITHMPEIIPDDAKIFNMENINGVSKIS